MTVSEAGQEQVYPLISDTVYNISNVLSFVALMRELGTSREALAAFLRTQQVTRFRETCVEYGGVRYYTYAAKGQSVSAASTVFEYLAAEPSRKMLVLVMDEMQDRNHATETLTWLYETDFELLNSPNIQQIVVGGHMFLNHRLRLLLAGVPEERLVCMEDESRIPDYVKVDGAERVYVLFEVDFPTKARNIRDAIIEKQKGRKQP
ncbi:MAG: DUF1727 domain-containing protein [Oscillospiraceae bacterium]|nr:DUF1727 domain-containing protein [Oscillospiraceae bacterium]